MRAFLAAAGCARVADEMVGVAVVLLVLDRTGSPALAGAMVTAYTLPSVALALTSLPAGTRWGTRLEYPPEVSGSATPVSAASANATGVPAVSVIPTHAQASSAPPQASTDLR
jgi:hypothetical protein